MNGRQIVILQFYLELLDNYLHLFGEVNISQTTLHDNPNLLKLRFHKIRAHASDQYLIHIGNRNGHPTWGSG